MWVSCEEQSWKHEWDLNWGRSSESTVRCFIAQATWCQHLNQTCTVSMNKTSFLQGEITLQLLLFNDGLTISCGPPPKQDVQWDQDGSYRIQVHQLRHLVLLVHTLGTWSTLKAKLDTIIIIKCYTNQKKLINI